MALTSDVKDELARIEVTKSATRVAELSAILRFAGGLHLISGRVVIEVEVDAASIARRVRKDLMEVLGIESELAVIAPSGIRRTSRYQVRVIAQGDLLARRAGLIDRRVDRFVVFRHTWSRARFKKRKLFGAERFWHTDR